MTTIMSVGRGRNRRRCDATCHNATKPSCSCICGGRYHGVRAQAETMYRADVLAGMYGKDEAQTARKAGAREGGDDG